MSRRNVVTRRQKYNLHTCLVAHKGQPSFIMHSTLSQHSTSAPLSLNSTVSFRLNTSYKHPWSGCRALRKSGVYYDLRSALLCHHVPALFSSRRKNNKIIVACGYLSCPFRLSPWVSSLSFSIAFFLFSIPSPHSLYISPDYSSTHACCRTDDRT